MSRIGIMSRQRKKLKQLRESLKICEYYLDDEPAYYHHENRCEEYKMKFHKDCEHCVIEGEE